MIFQATPIGFLPHSMLKSIDYTADSAAPSSWEEVLRGERARGEIASALFFYSTITKVLPCYLILMDQEHNEKNELVRKVLAQGILLPPSSPTWEVNSDSPKSLS